MKRTGLRRVLTLGAAVMALPGCTPAYDWTESLAFDPSAGPGTPSPNMGMNLVAHKGKLYLGASTGSEPIRFSGRSSYVYRKDSAASAWMLDSTFESSTERIGAMESVTFANGAGGSPIPGGPVTMLVAATNQNLTDPGKPVQARTRDDATGRWTSAPVSIHTSAISQVREIGAHRDAVTGADLVFLAASPAPLGIYSGVYDATATGRIRWNPIPEVPASSDRDKEKWFGMDEANGSLYASNNTAIYRRVDGTAPRWEQVADAADTGSDAARNPEFRGLTAVPNPKAMTGWPEAEMLVFSYGNGLWRMRAGGSHAIVLEFDLAKSLESRLKAPVPLAEAAFNRLNPVRRPDGTLRWPIGFQFYNPGIPGIDPSAMLLLRNERGAYSMDQITLPQSPARPLILARDIVPSPFPGEDGYLYATGYNASAAPDSGFRGRAWVARGKPRPASASGAPRRAG